MMSMKQADTVRFASLVKRNEGNLKGDLHRALTDFGSPYRPFSVSKDYSEALARSVALDIETLGNIQERTRQVPIVSGGHAAGSDLMNLEGKKAPRIKEIMEGLSDDYFKLQELTGGKLKNVDVTDIEQLRRLIQSRADWFDPTQLVEGTKKEKMLKNIVDAQAKKMYAAEWFQSFLKKAGKPVDGTTILIHNVNFEAAMMAAHMAPDKFHEQIGQHLHRSSLNPAKWLDNYQRMYVTSPEVYNAGRLARQRPNYQNYRTVFREWSRHLDAKVTGAKVLDTMDLSMAVVGMAENKGYAKKVNYAGAVRVDDYMKARFGISEIHLGAPDALAELAMTNDLLHIGRKMDRGIDLEAHEASLIRKLSEAKQDKGRRLGNYAKSMAQNMERLLQGESVRIAQLAEEGGRWIPVGMKDVENLVKQADGSFKKEKVKLFVPDYTETKNVDVLIEHTRKRVSEEVKGFKGEFDDQVKRLRSMYEEAKAGGDKAKRHISQLARMNVDEHVSAAFNEGRLLPGFRGKRLKTALSRLVELDKPPSFANRYLQAVMGGAGAALVIAGLTENQPEDDYRRAVGASKTEVASIGTLVAAGVTAGSLSASLSNIPSAKGESLTEFVKNMRSKGGSMYLGALTGAVSLAAWGLGTSLYDFTTDSETSGNLVLGGVGAASTFYLSKNYQHAIRSGADPTKVTHLMENAWRKAMDPEKGFALHGRNNKVLEWGKNLHSKLEGTAGRYFPGKQALAGMAVVGAGLLALGESFGVEKAYAPQGMSTPYNPMGGIQANNDPRWRSGAGEGQIVHEWGRTQFHHIVESAKGLLKTRKGPNYKGAIPSVKKHPHVFIPERPIQNAQVPELKGAAERDLSLTEVLQKPKEQNFIYEGPLYSGKDMRVEMGALKADKLVTHKDVEWPERIPRQRTKKFRLDSQASRDIINIGEVGAKKHNAVYNAYVGPAKSQSANSWNSFSSVR